ncbi:putative type VI secretion system effector [Gilliamella bombi]|uniref:putative type VI secretion system effector n=1 Tax=Gilliamella bombi TaxID=1908521 RepID=UPI000A162ACA|nr:putative type VI secretion system effector [Gilliamella bombi]
MTLKSFYKIQNQMVDKSWRHHATPPVLPCLGDEFTCIRGTIKYIDLQMQQQAFEVESYQNMQESMKRTNRAAQIGAIIGTLRGQVGLTSMAETKPVLRNANFVNVQIEKEIYRGWVGDCPFQPGDEVIVVAEWQHDHYELYAIAKPDERIICVCPNCFRGRWAYIRYCLPRTVIMIFFALLFFTCLDIYSYGLDAILSLDTRFVENIRDYGIVLGVFGIIGLFIAIKDSFKTKVKIAEQTFKALNLKKISRLDLRKFTNRKCWKLKFQGKYNVNDKKPNISYKIKVDDNNLFYY